MNVKDRRYEKLIERLTFLEQITEPRLRALVTLRAQRFALRQWLQVKAGALPAHAERLSELLVRDGENQSSLTFQSPTIAPQTASWGELGIAVFLFSRPDLAEHMLESLARQDALHITHVFIDGDQGNPALRRKIDTVRKIVDRYRVKSVEAQRSSFGFRKMILLAGKTMAAHYNRIVFLEDDCFPVDGAIEEFQRALDTIERRDDIFSVYGHHFLCDGEGEHFGRFQPWGWATTREKLLPVWGDLERCFMMTERDYLAYVEQVFTPQIEAHIERTPGRQPSSTLSKFFAWDETVCLLAALRGQYHCKTQRRVIYNCGMGAGSTHFDAHAHYREPPFNMVSPDEVWSLFSP